MEKGVLSSDTLIFRFGERLLCTIPGQNRSHWVLKLAHTSLALVLVGRAAEAGPNQDRVCRWILWRGRGGLSIRWELGWRSPCIPPRALISCSVLTALGCYDRTPAWMLYVEEKLILPVLKARKSKIQVWSLEWDHLRASGWGGR